MKIFEIPGKIKGKQRPRFYNGHVITAKETINYENWIKSCYLKKYELDGQNEKPLKISIIAYIPIPKSYTKKKILENKYPLKKLDADNIAKIVLDSLNGIAYKDDNKVIELEVKKFWGELEKIVVTIEELI